MEWMFIINTIHLRMKKVDIVAIKTLKKDLTSICKKIIFFI